MLIILCKQKRGTQLARQQCCSSWSCLAHARFSCDSREANGGLQLSNCKPSAACQGTPASNAHLQLDCFMLRASTASKYLLAEKGTSFLPVCPAGMTSISGSTYARQDLWCRAAIFAVMITRTIAIQLFFHKFATLDMTVMVFLRIVYLCLCILILMIVILLAYVVHSSCPGRL